MNEISNEKISALQNIILEHANQQREALTSNARKEAEQWLSQEVIKLERETNSVLTDARSRAEDIHRRQILSAEREKATEALRQQNRLLGEALKKFQDGLVHLRDRPDYVDVLVGLTVEAARTLADETGTLRLKLAALDASLGDKVAEAVNGMNLGFKMIFDHDPAPIIGGCWVTSEDGRRQINSDWQSRTQEMSDVIAERLLPLL
ncbi:MAG: V-type ATP synthase subunit E family protein [Synergistaceae bacterium]|nr:V-type ATP synthase subunit E family protein [Synergistaceae bacterium]